MLNKKFLASITVGERSYKTKNDFRFDSKRKTRKSPRIHPRIMYIQSNSIIDALTVVKKVKKSTMHYIEEISQERYQRGVSGKADHGLAFTT